ncbi:MAG: hypothetical protein Q9198_009513 [Flavoplaca austrocitrina]
MKKEIDVMFTGVYHGVGKHASTLSDFDLRQALLAFYISQIFYKLAINSTKISVIFLYRRIFTNIISFRRLTSVFMLFILLSAFASILATIFQCTPIRRAFDHQRERSCIDLKAFWYTNAISNIATDLVILALPQRLIYQLQMPRRLKVGLYSIFGLGLITVSSTLWSTIEVHTGIICACLPTLKKPLSALYKRCFMPSGSNGDEGVDSSSRTLRAREEGFRVIERRERDEEDVAVGMDQVHEQVDARGKDVERGGGGGFGGQSVMELERRVRVFSGEVERKHPSIVHLI